ncbi:hypothetical protein CI088_11930 [Enterococcus plantarum]|uniref:Antitoxin SocA-like Panacea domain-containing protein n=1 Tax=Enterococcus plantarum TaxID=1077675 RepID=A0A2W3ZS47_9ENTE|nr:type II toxin-antitoxin system antitoxin SocA domain-containing protein [Enterococcus plantarum]PZL71703.1 hypothetical protein CI088_11930 [Enterococcus plantarum]
MWNANKVANWFLVRHSSEMQRDEAVDENLTQMKLHKLMYYAQGVNLAVFSNRLFDEDLLAWKHGPVVRSVYDRFQGLKELDVTVDDEQLENYEEIANDSNSRMVLEAVYEQYGGFSAGQLRNMTHSEKPWIEARDSGEDSPILDDDTIEQYFKENIVEV